MPAEVMYGTKPWVEFLSYPLVEAAGGVAPFEYEPRFFEYGWGEVDVSFQILRLVAVSDGADPYAHFGGHEGDTLPNAVIRPPGVI